MSTQYSCEICGEDMVEVEGPQLCGKQTCELAYLRTQQSFTESELEELAEFVCGRVDNLQELVDDPHITDKNFKRGAKSALQELDSLNKKLRPFYQNRT